MKLCSPNGQALAENRRHYIKSLHLTRIFPQIFQVSVTDPDLGPSGVVRYSLVPDSNGHYNSFTLNPLNGTIYTNVSFDREKLGLYIVTVRATDQPTSGQGRYGTCFCFSVFRSIP